MPKRRKKLPINVNEAHKCLPINVNEAHKHKCALCLSTRQFLLPII
ncbi:hypothetical protein LTSEWAN_2537 [Salmonella enterica subsp. enterica serovar Wandsworth str. A4-580]|uniref:Uncharacterized protein n=1 Tax=Salmonella enterica subsp. enterica serovar Wandsworth str. A4-580 TaxID=913086 RepID=G5SBK0_SALET|nr:hypothetical protein LTSEWAN_2537 [Salmonella enterica subsp. enterica serovar Wandsworth str. A4-580]